MAVTIECKNGKSQIATSCRTERKRVAIAHDSQFPMKTFGIYLPIFYKLAVEELFLNILSQPSP